MPKDEWGVKRACPECAVRFYDLRNDPMTCPSCGVIFDIASLSQSKQRVVERPKPAPKKAVVPPPSEESDDLVFDDDDSSSTPASTSDASDDLLDDDDDSNGLETIADVPKDEEE